MIVNNKQVENVLFDNSKRMDGILFASCCIPNVKILLYICCTLRDKKMVKHGGHQGISF